MSEQNTQEHPRAAIVAEMIERYAEKSAADIGTRAWATYRGRQALADGMLEADAIKLGIDELDFALERFRRTDALPGADVSCRVLSPAAEHEDVHVESMDYQGAPGDHEHSLRLTIRHIPSGQRRILTCEPARANVVGIDAAAKAGMEAQA